MLRKVNLAIRVVALALVGVEMFTVPFGRPRNVVTDLVAFAIAVLTVVLWTVAGSSPRARARLTWVLPFVVGAMAVTSGWATLTSNGGPFSLLAAMATIWAGSALNLAAASVLTGAAVVAQVSAGLAFGASTWDTVGVPLVMILSLNLGRIMRDHSLQAAQSARLLETADKMREEQRRAATLEERNRIAREIHDVLAHSLGALGVQIQTAQALLTDQGDIARAVELLGQARRMASTGLEDTRRALHALRAGAPPLAEALADLSAGHEHAYGNLVSFEVAGPPRPLSADAGLALVRTAQEALVNTAKHAPHQPVDVRLDFGAGRTTLTVANRELQRVGGPPTLETANGGYGLAGMRERLLLIDGSLSAGSDGGGNWVVTAQVPQ